jgi:hypothetical protein
MSEPASAIGGAPAPGTEIITHVTAESIAEVLRRTGYRATIAVQGGAPQVQSAAQGLGFLVVFGNAAPGLPGAWIDYTLQCLIALETELPAGLVEDWNRGMRFARLFRQDRLLVLSMDVMVAGGVTDAFLCAQCELWDRVIHDFVRHVRGDAPRGGAAAPAPSAAA